MVKRLLIGWVIAALTLSSCGDDDDHSTRRDTAPDAREDGGDDVGRADAMSDVSTDPITDTADVFDTSPDTNNTDTSDVDTNLADAHDVDPLAPDTSMPCPPDTHRVVDGACLPSCSFAGGNTCVPAGGDALECEGQEGRGATYDCAVCCQVCDRRRPRPLHRPQVLYYGLPQSGGAWSEPLATRLIIPNVDVTFALRNNDFEAPGFTPASAEVYPSCLPHRGLEFSRFQSRGASLAKNVSNEDFQSWLTRGPGYAALRVDRILRYGWDYVTVDEIGGVAWRDTERYGRLMEAFFRENATRGNQRRISFFLNPNTVQMHKPASDRSPLHLYANLFRMCQTHCRALLFETYPSNSATYAPGSRISDVILTSTVMNHGTAEHIENLARRISAAQTGTNRVAISVLGVRNDMGIVRPQRFLNMPACDIAPTRGSCAGGRSGLMRQFDVLTDPSHTARAQFGMAFYSLAGIEDTSRYTVADVVEHLRMITSYWSGRADRAP